MYKARNALLADQQHASHGAASKHTYPKKTCNEREI